MPLKELISEPVAAGGYFLNRYEQLNGETFSGNFIIFDYGGGTLDISLLRLENNDLEVLERTGNGNSIESLGNAGTAYDEAVVQYIYKQNNKPIDKNSQEYTELLIEFEKQKIEKNNIYSYLFSIIRMCTERGFVWWVGGRWMGLVQEWGWENW